MDNKNLPARVGGKGARFLPENETAGGTVSTDELRRAADYARAEKSDATRRNYAQDFDDFRAWCARRRADPLPASVETTAAYLAALADRGLKASTIARRAAAIGYAHRLAGHEPPTKVEAVKAVLRGIRRRIGVKRDQKAPATDRVIARMLKRIPPTTKGKRDRALLLIGFAGALRRSELVDLKVNDIERTAEGIILHIGRSKTDQEGKGAIIPIPHGRKLKPVEALDDWLAFARIADGPVFRPVDKIGRALDRPLTPHSVALIVKGYARKLRLDAETFAGHSLRAGFVTSALEDGADVFKVMDITRHTSVDTLREYDRRAQAFKKHAGKGFL